MLDVKKIKEDFPIFKNAQMAGEPFYYLDSAASSQTPERVVLAMQDYYFKYRSNVHRSMYLAGERATSAYEGVREKLANFLGARSSEEIVFTGGATMSINSLAEMLGRSELLPAGGNYLISVAEHHSNILPFQNLAKEKGATIRYFGLNESFDFEDFENLLDSETRLFIAPLASNVTGTIFPIEKLNKVRQKTKALILIDASKAFGHHPINVSQIELDFLYGSAHKALGPTGVGFLYGKLELLKKLPPAQFGGGMVNEASLEKEATYLPPPLRFEAGTPNVAGVIGFGEAITYLQKIGLKNIEEHIQGLVSTTIQRLKEIAGLKIYAQENPQKNIGIVSFLLAETHPHDVASILGQGGVAIRGGHHCAMPLMKYLKIPAVNRASFYFYNDLGDVSALVENLISLKENLKSK